MTEKKVYCGINNLKKGEKFGTMEECALKKQVRRYGVYKADTMILKAVNDSKKKEKSRNSLILEYATLNGKISKLKKALIGEKSSAKKKIIEDQLISAKNKLKNLNSELRGGPSKESPKETPIKRNLKEELDVAIIKNKSKIDSQKMDLNTSLSKSNNEYIASYQKKLPGKIQKMKKMLDQMDENNDKIRKLSKSSYSKNKMIELVNKADVVESKYNKLAYENLLEEGIKSYYDILVNNPFFQNEKEIKILMSKLKVLYKINIELANKYPKDRHFVALKRFQNHLFVQAQSKEFFSKDKLKGGSLMNKNLRLFIQESHKSDMNDVGDFKIDKSLSSKWVKVYYNPINKQCVVVHRGSSDSSDAWVDTKLFFQQKNNERFKVSESTQKKAEKKYGAKNVTTVGSSLGGYLAEEFGANSKEIITVSKPTTPLDIVKGKKKRSNQFDVRNSKDVIASLQNFQKNKNDIIVKTDSFNPLTNHMGDDVLKELPDNLMIGKGLTELVNKMPVKDLKVVIKALRQAQKLGPKAYPIVGMKKPDLKNMVVKLSDKMVGGALNNKKETLWQKLNSKLAYDVAFPLFNALIKKLEGGSVGGTLGGSVGGSLGGSVGGGSTSFLYKMTPTQLKTVLKIMKKHNIGKSKEFNLMNKSKDSMIEMIKHVKDGKVGGGISDNTSFWNDINESVAVNIVFPLFKLLFSALD